MAVLLLLMMMTALASVLAVSGRTETLISRNHQSAAQARLAAEAGLNHAAQVAIAWLRQWPNSYASVDAALDDLLQNHGTLIDSDDLSFDTEITLANNIRYQVSLVDEDDASRAGGAQTLEDDDDESNNEDGVATTDDNRHLVIRAIGYARYGENDSTVEIEAVIGPHALPAIVTDGDLTITGNTTVISGATGGIHANGDLSLAGTSLVVVGTPDLDDGSVTSSGDYSASGTPVITGASGGSKATKEVPEVDADDYRSWADYILTTDGRITDLAGATTYCNTNNGSNQTACRNTYGWRFNGAWNLDYANPTAGEGTFFAETTGTVTISGSPGSALDPHAITLISRGSINITGSAHIAPANAEILFVTEGDFRTNGSFQIHANVALGINEGQILVQEQIELGGTPVILGQIIVEDAAAVSTLVTSSSIGGNVTLIYSGAAGASIFKVAGWRQVR